ncbi:hypothetical protein G8759_04945 [Spirosoma aureum]|uniref:Rhamnogalacturonase A/B/Epimerase-like pectate lyase domain-containing protein n=1 Tax=Spirosoma aureum TaxID=2692134 RepID=A0A6G9AIC3_9BACT|nr:glycosyl hydrolase family 28-related protein [Spirosoma aureum]QIP12025.1 hypothetical protein G8759_04945 [Spirosoma aureum]
MKISLFFTLMLVTLFCQGQKKTTNLPRESTEISKESLSPKPDGYWYIKTKAGKEVPLKIDPKANNLTTYQSIAKLRESILTNASAPATVNITDSGKQGIFILDTNDITTPDNTGTVLVTRSKLRYKRVIEGAISVRWFGAKGDGSNTDDSPAIQAAINFATELQDPAKDGAFSSKWKGRDLTVYLPLGTYKINHTIHISGTIKLQGSAGGAYAGTQLIQGVTGISMISLDAGSDKVSNATVIEDIIFKSGSAKQSPTVSQIIIGTGNGNSNYIRNCWFQTPENLAIWITKGGDIQISGCTFDVVPFQAIAIGKTSQPPVVDVSIMNNTFFEVSLDIIRLYSGKGITVSNNRVSNSINSNHSTTFINGYGADIITSLSVTGNEYTNVRNFANLPIHLFGCSISSNAGYNTDGYFIKANQPGVIYGVSIIGNSIYSSAANKNNKLIDIANSSGLQGSAIVGNSFYSINVTQLNAISMPSENNLNNEIAHNTFTNIASPYAVNAPEKNGIINIKSFVSIEDKTPVAGDLLYYDGTKWTRIPKGTNGQILKMVSGVPAWSIP